jgi:hypothetical protein
VGRALLLVALLLGSGCAPGIDVHADWDPAARFEQMHTWAWLPGSLDPALGAVPGRQADPLVQQRIQRAIESGLATRGYVQLQSGAPDFYVAYHTAIDEKIDAQTVYPGYGVSPYGRVWPGPPETYIDTYELGTVLIDVIDPESRQLLWRGTAQSRLQELKDPEQREARVRKAVEGMLSKFPPRLSAAPRA